MASSPPNPDVDTYAAGLDRWRAEFDALRALLLATGLDEEIKWRKPCYSSDGSNIVIFQPFKGQCALLFFQGALLSDNAGLLREQGANSQSSLRLEFRSLDDVRTVKPHLAGYVEEAVANARDGVQVERRSTAEYPMPEELLMRFDEDARFREAFESLTPGRQRGYLLHFSDAKQSATRFARIDRAAPRIFDGLGMHD